MSGLNRIPGVLNPALKAKISQRSRGVALEAANPTTAYALGELARMRSV
jgi:hypothetical protein